MLHNFLSRPLSFLGWTTAMLFWLDFYQAQSNFYKWFRMLRHDWSSTSQKEPMLHLSLSHCTGYRLQLASSSRHWCLQIEQPQAQHPTSTHIPVHHSWLVEWPSYPYPECWIPVNLQATTENSSLSTVLDFILNFQKNYKNIFYFSLFIPSLASLYLFEQCLRLGITSTSSVCLPL